jgi:hypothetical protein
MVVCHSVLNDAFAMANLGLLYDNDYRSVLVME